MKKSKNSRKRHKGGAKSHTKTFHGYMKLLSSPGLIKEDRPEYYPHFGNYAAIAKLHATPDRGAYYSLLGA